jgi:pimeloyl-ACP methyl ester carboxylesterase
MTRRETRKVGTRSLSWLESGSSSAPRVIVWLHAFPLSAAMWIPQLEMTPDGWRAIAPDLTGLGQTADHAGPPLIEDFARDVDTLMAALGVTSAVIAGLSMGGYAALALHRVAPARFAGLILADTKSTADTPQARAGREQMLNVVESRGADGVAEVMMPKLLGRTSHASRPDVTATVRGLINGNTATGIARAVKRLRDRPDSTPGLASITVPTLVIVGEEDVITPVDDSRALADGIAGATLVVLPESGHLSNLETPDAFNTTALTWLGALPAPRA